MSATPAPSTITTASLVPERVQKILDLAVELGMTVEFDDSYRDAYVWTIGSGKHLDFDRVFIYWWGPGPNGGRTAIKRYSPFARRRPSRLTNLTFRGARQWLRILAGAL
jgi:hypothetical protein